VSTREITYKVCDKHPCKRDAVATRTYLWFGTRYSVDVCEEHDEKLHDALEPWTSVSTVLTQTLSTSPLAAPVHKVKPEQPARLRLTGPEKDWRHTIHSLERCEERGIDVEESRRVAQWPTWRAPSTKGPEYEERMSNDLLVVVVIDSHEIVTVAKRMDQAVAQ
jgi:hypothetical protein